MDESQGENDGLEMESIPSVALPKAEHVEGDAEGTSDAVRFADNHRSSGTRRRYNLISNDGHT